jgi:spore germination cell wall hydrolase CwlJ-like protein
MKAMPRLRWIATLAGVGTLACALSGQASAASLQEEHQCLALTLYFEARGEGRAGMVAVGWTVLNRVQAQDFPGTPCEVVRQGGETPPCQFSWWCDGRSDRPRERRSWQSAQLIAAELLRDPPGDPTAGALYFHHTGVRAPWQRERTVTIGRHVFYR